MTIGGAFHAVERYDLCVYWSTVVEYPLEHCSSLYMHGRSIQCRMTREDAMYILMLRLLCGPLGGRHRVYFRALNTSLCFVVANNIPVNNLLITFLPVPPSSSLACLIIVKYLKFRTGCNRYSHYTHMYIHTLSRV